MSNSAGRITSPISLHADVYSVLGLSKSGTYYDVGYACGNTHGKINKLSARKPYKIATPQPITEAQIKGFNYGMTPKEFQLAEIRGSKDLTPSLVWTQWAAPVPGTDWCRLTDFNGYDHNHSKEAVAEVRLYNSQNSQSQLPVVIEDNELDLYDIGYYGVLVLNRDAQVDLMQMHRNRSDLKQFKDMYLTLVIGANIGGLNAGSESMYAQADMTLEEQMGSSGATASVYMRTSVAGFKDMLDMNSGKNIIVLGLAPSKWSTGGETELYSLAMYRDMGSVLWNDSYATFGDGQGGGTRPTYNMYGHMENLTNNVTLENNYDDGAGTIFIRYTGSYPTVRVTSGGGGGGLNVGIAILYEVTATDGSGGGTVLNSDRMTELLLLNGVGSQIYVNGPSEAPWDGRMGVLVQLPSYSPGQQFNVRCKFLIYTERADGNVQTVAFRSDGQGLGIETDWFDAGTVTVNY